MSTEEPAWKAELIEDLSKYDAYASQWLPLVEPHILAAEERGRREALENFSCGACGHRVLWIDCPTGGWWSHAVHPADGHDAAECLPGVDSP